MSALAIRQGTIPHLPNDLALLRQEVVQLRAELRAANTARAHVETAMGKMWADLSRFRRDIAELRTEVRVNREQPEATIQSGTWHPCFICGARSRCRHREPELAVWELSRRGSIA